MKQLSIFADCHVFDGIFQGTTTYLKGLYLELIKDHSKTFYFAACDTENLKSIFGEQSNIVYIRYRSKNKFVRLLYDIPKIISKHNIDFAHFQYIVPPIKKCEYIVTIHDVLFLDFPQYFPTAYKLKNALLFRASAKYSDVVLTVSAYSKTQIQKHFKIGKVTITPNAVDPVFFNSYNKPDTIQKIKEKYGFEKYWLFVSRWEPRKNHDMLLKVFIESGFYKDFQLVLVGDPAIPNEKYDAYFKKLDERLKQKITVLNKVGFENLLLLVRGAELSVYPSVAEGFGIPPLEAIAANIPAICSKTTAMADFDFMEDCLFNPYDPADLSEKATTALQFGNVVLQRQAVADRYNWSAAATAFWKALDR